jgi:hypothetical protein
MQTLVFEAMPYEVEEVRKLIAQRVRLCVTEKRQGFWPLHSYLLTVTGPDHQLQAVASEIDEAKVQLFEDRQW